MRPFRHSQNDREVAFVVGTTVSSCSRGDPFEPLSAVKTVAARLSRETDNGAEGG